VFGLIAGVVTGAVGYVVAGVTTILRRRPAGRRSAHVLAHVTFPFAAAMVVVVLASVIDLVLG
jgi:hypothetical protein